MRVQREENERLTPPERRLERLLVAVPELLAPADASHGSPEQARQPDANRQVEPDDHVGRAQQQVAELAVIRAVDHPAVRAQDRLDPGAQLLVGRLGPVRPVHERIHLDERHLEPLRELLPERRLAVPARAADHRHFPHRRNLLAGGPEPRSNLVRTWFEGSRLQSPVSWPGGARSSQIRTRTPNLANLVRTWFERGSRVSALTCARGPRRRRDRGCGRSPAASPRTGRAGTPRRAHRARGTRGRSDGSRRRGESSRRAGAAGRAARPPRARWRGNRSAA